MSSVAEDDTDAQGGEPETASVSEVGRVLAQRYELRRVLGEGGFGMVYEAEDRRLEKRVAVKLLTSAVAKKPDALGRFKQEAIAAARIGHAGIVDVTDFDQDADGTHFIVMELIDGIDLAQAMDGEPLPLPRALAIASRVAQTLAQAHERGIIHRDLKPANIMLTALGGVEDFVKVLDFGISKVLSVAEDVSVTATGHVVGTPRYMAPEQGLGDKTIDGRVDVYALGGILYEMATGHPPYESSSQYELIHHKLTFAPRPPSIVATHAELPLELDRLLLRALAREPGDRFATMADFEGAIRELLEKIAPATAALVRPSTPLPRPAATPARQSSINRTPSAKVASVATKVLPTRRKPGSSTDEDLARSPSQADLDRALAAPTPTPVVQPLPRPVAAGSGTSRSTLAMALLLGAGVIAAVYLAIRPPWEGARPSPPPPAPAVQATAAVAVPAVDAAPIAAPPEDVEVALTLEPPTARVELDGVITTANPIRLPRSARIHVLVVSARGHRAKKLSIPATSSLPVVVRLVPERASTAGEGGGQRLPDSPL